MIGKTFCEAKWTGERSLSWGGGRPDGRLTVILLPKGAGQNILLQVAFGLGSVGQLRGRQADEAGTSLEAGGAGKRLSLIYLRKFVEEKRGWAQP